MNVHFHPLARDELEHAVDYYEEEREGLGMEFLEEVYSCIQRIVKFPAAWSPISPDTPNTRRCLTNRFPYGILYRERNDAILILAISHLHQKPGYWQQRQ